MKIQKKDLAIGGLGQNENFLNMFREVFGPRRKSLAIGGIGQNTSLGKRIADYIRGNTEQPSGGSYSSNPDIVLNYGPLPSEKYYEGYNSSRMGTRYVRPDTYGAANRGFMTGFQPEVKRRIDDLNEYATVKNSKDEFMSDLNDMMQGRTFDVSGLRSKYGGIRLYNEMLNKLAEEYEYRLDNPNAQYEYPFEDSLKYIDNAIDAQLHAFGPR